jgi:hypothetical protein
MKQKVWSYLKTLMEEPDIQLEYVMDSREAMRTFGLEGRSIFILTGKLPIAFGEQAEGDDIWGSLCPGDHKIGAATHGGAPEREDLTAFLACGPDVRAARDRRSPFHGGRGADHGAYARVRDAKNGRQGHRRDHHKERIGRRYADQAGPSHEKVRRHGRGKRPFDDHRGRKLVTLLGRPAAGNLRC